MRRISVAAKGCRRYATIPHAALPAIRAVVTE